MAARRRWSPTAASGAEGGYERTVFTLEVFSDGKYEFKLFDQLDHDPPHDFFTDGVSALPGRRSELRPAGHRSGRRRQQASISAG